MKLRSTAKKLSQDELWNYALKALGQRAHSVAEIRRKLGRRAATRADVDATLAKLREYGLINDAKYSEAFAQSRFQTGSFGRYRVLRDLRGKQVPDAVATSAVNQAYAGQDEAAAIREYLQRKYRGKNLPELLKEKRHLASVFRRLRTAGFGSSAILTVLKGYAAGLDPDWEGEPADEPES